MLNSTSADTLTGRPDVALRNMNTYLAYSETNCFPDKMLCYSNYRQCDDFVEIYPYKKVKRLVFGVLSNYLAAWFWITVHTHTRLEATDLGWVLLFCCTCIKI